MNNPRKDTLYPKRYPLKQKSLMLHGIGFISGDPTIKLAYPFVFHPGIQITVTEPGDAKWIYMMLPFSKGDLITEIRIAYHYSGSRSRISFIRLVEQREPVGATVLHDSKMAEEVPSRFVASTDCHIVVDRSILLKVCLDFASTDDMIEIGSVEIRHIPEYESIQDSGKKEKENGRLFLKW